MIREDKIFCDGCNCFLEEKKIYITSGSKNHYCFNCSVELYF